MRHALVVMMVMALGCGDDKGGIVEAKAPGIEVREGSSPIPRATTLLIGSSLRMTVANPGAGDLLIRELTLDATHDAFDLVMSPTPTASAPVVIAPGATWAFDITYDAAAVPAGQRARADIALRTNTTLPEGLDSFVVRGDPRDDQSRSWSWSRRSSTSRRSSPARPRPSPSTS